MAATWIHKYVVYRVDHYLWREGASIDTLITIKEVVDTAAEAMAEVERLSGLKGGEGSEYRWQSAKYYPEGRLPLGSIRPTDEAD